MKKLLLLFSLLYVYSTQAQMTDTTLLIGTIEAKVLQQYSWYGKQYSTYKADATSIETLRSFAADIKLVVVLGTWCGDSKEHVPALLKIADEAGIQAAQIELIGVDRKKQCPLPDISLLHIEYVPTIFVFYQGKLKGKIVETPQITIEQDLLALIQK